MGYNQSHFIDDYMGSRLWTRCSMVYIIIILVIAGFIFVDDTNIINVVKLVNTIGKDLLK